MISEISLEPTVDNVDPDENAGKQHNDLVSQHWTDHTGLRCVFRQDSSDYCSAKPVVGCSVSSWFVNLLFVVNKTLMAVR
jgi:hypothetical protein